MTEPDKTTLAERIADAIAEDQPCTCGEAGRCPCCMFDKVRAVEITNRELVGQSMNADQLMDLKILRHRNSEMKKTCIKAIDELMSWDSHAAEDSATSLGYTVEILRAAVKE